MKRRELLRAECGCFLEGPDSFGNYDLIENPACEEHGRGDQQDADVAELPQWLASDEDPAA